MISRLAVLLGLAVLAGCDAPPQRSPRNVQTVRLSAELPAPALEMGLASEIKVVLPGPKPGSDYIWEVASNNTQVLEQMGPLTRVPAPVAPEPGPTTTVSFYSLRPGKSLLEFVLVRPTEAEATPAATCKVTVRISE